MAPKKMSDIKQLSWYFLKKLKYYLLSIKRPLQHNLLIIKPNKQTNPTQNTTLQPMINSLYQINSALTNLTQQLASNQTSNQTLRRSIQNLLSQVKYLDQKEKYQYYLLVAEVYAFRFQNVQDAEKQLQQFAKTLDSEVSMNCQLRMGFFKYFQLNYKQAYKHLDLGLGEVEEQLKLSENAKFFFNRAFNKQYLISQAKEKNNFQAAFILSLIYQNQKEQITALKQLQHFLVQANQGFVKFQIYKRLLQLYQVMKKNSISTISISKKSLQTYRQELSHIETKNPQFQQNYIYKSKFVTRIITFISNQSTVNSDKLNKKLLDFKLLAYYKLKKCSKQAPTKEIKMTLQNTAKIIKQSKETQLLQSLLNYDFIKKEYELFKVFYKPSLFRKLAAIKFLSLISDKNLKQSPQTQISHSFGKPQKQSKLMKQQPILVSKVSYQKQSMPQSQYVSMKKNNSYLTAPTFSQLKMEESEQPVMSQVTSMKKNSSYQKAPTFSQFDMIQSMPLQMKETISEDILNAQFEGSKMYKFNASSEGCEERYFYIKPDSLKEKPRLYYCLSKNSKSSADSYYSLKGLTKIIRGKQTDALRRKEASKFSENQCFALAFEKEKDRSFYVPNEDDYQRWIILLQTKVLYTEMNINKMSHTMGMATAQQSKYNNMNKSSPPVKKVSKIIDI